MQRKITQWTPLALAILLVAGVAAARQQAAMGIGLVNLQAVMTQTPGYEDALETFRQEFEPEEQQLETMVQRRDSMIAEYERQSVVLSPTGRQEKETEIRNLQQRVEQLAADFQQRRQNRERELVAPLETRVQAVIEGIRAERNLAIVFDVASTPGIVAADPGSDLTTVVLQRLQQTSPSQP